VPVKIVALCGSLRRDSLNRKLLKALAARAPEGVEVELAELHGIPVYDGDLEGEAFPEAVTALQDRIAAADGLLIGSPEYNGGVPGPLKNGIDWCTRGGRMQEVFGGRPVAICGATPGGGGTRHSQQSWLQTFRVLGVDPWTAGQLYVARAGSLFDDDGGITDDRTERHIAGFIEGFAAFVRARAE